MKSEEAQNIARQVLIALYPAWESNGHISLDALRNENQWDKQDFAHVLNQLEHQHGFIRHYGGWAYDLTATGVLYLEENSLVHEQKINRHRELRHHALEYLANLWDERGPRAHVNVDEIAKAGPVKYTVEILVDLSLLAKLNYLEAASATSYRITREGLQYHRGESYEDIV